MPGKLVDLGKYHYLDILFVNVAVDANVYLGLYKNVAEPAVADGMADLTEVSGGGYARIALARGTWVRTADEVEYAEQTFTASGASFGEVTGYFICSAASGVSGVSLYSVENFSDGSKEIPDGKSLIITPKITIT